MKTKRSNHSLSISCFLLIATCSSAHAGTMGEAALPQDRIYFGIFGGGAGVSTGDIRQEGTAFYTEAAGGPLAVDAKGTAHATSAWILGGHIGHKFLASMNHLSSNFSVTPAAELEGYYIGGATVTGDEINNNTTRLPEHDFYSTYPMHTGVFLVNAVLNVNAPNWGRFHPYTGVGFGPSIISVREATAVQLAPPEPGVNHYNSHSSDSSLALAAQPKIGIAFNLTQSASLFVEYRFLYLTATKYTFGSTSYPAHPATSNWDVKIGDQYYNIGTVGIELDV